MPARLNQTIVWCNDISSSAATTWRSGSSAQRRIDSLRAPSQVVRRHT